MSDVIDSLRTSAGEASRLVATTSGYRAGLLASIAASCTASYTVALVPSGPSI
ncbi:conserved alanine rich transmembrane protein [Mycobacterium tuberculosis]|nr:conserved alanine rich transmembrane protein [Mycobacterium tuberculosis]